MDVLKVSSKSNPVSVAGAIAGIIREKSIVEVQGIGAGAVNQALKSIAVARGYVAPAGMDLICTPAFSTVEIEGETRTAMKLIVEIRR
ncbi:MAG: stage V sporulation protein S [Oscillospiraceae bacterium]